MAKEHQFLFNLKKNDLAIVRHYAANMIDYKVSRVMDMDEVVFLLNCMPTDMLDSISSILKKEGRKNSKSQTKSSSFHARRRKLLYDRNVCFKIADKIVDADVKEYTKILNIMKEFFNKDKTKNTAIHSKVKKLAKIYSLNKVEQMIVTALYYITILDCRDMFHDSMKEMICMFTGINYKEFEKCTHKKAALYIMK